MIVMRKKIQKMIIMHKKIQKDFDFPGVQILMRSFNIRVKS